jgi:hypothetical protein
MPRITTATRQSVRSESERFLAECGFASPPLPPDKALAARRLEVTPLSLDDLLVKANLSPHEQAKIQAVLDINERVIVFRSGLPIQKQNWGKLHEIGHEFLPWHRELLYCCSLLWLPASVQDQLESEADIFAAEAFFFGSQFIKLAAEGEFSLRTAKQLADQVYGTSYHATFMHFVEESSIPCCLLIWKPVQEDISLLPPHQLQLHHYVRSTTFNGHIPPGMNTDNEELLKILKDPTTEVVRHEVQVDLGQGQCKTIKAESFGNSYNVFTLVLQPQDS